MTNDGKLRLSAEEFRGMVIVQAENDFGDFDVPMDPDVAEQFAVMVMIAVQKARGE